MEPIQIIAIVFAVFFLSRVILRYRESQISQGELVFWGTISSLIILISAFPRILARVNNMLGVTRPLDVAVYTGLILLFYLVFRLYVYNQNLEREITVVVREMAKNGGKSKKK